VIGVLIFTDRFTIIARWLTPYLPTFWRRRAAVELRRTELPPRRRRRVQGLAARRIPRW